MRRVAELCVLASLVTACIYMLPAVGAVGLGVLGVVALFRAPRRMPIIAILAVVMYFAWGLITVVGAPGAQEVLRYGYLRWHLRGFLCYLPLFGMTLLHVTPGDQRLWVYFRSLSVPAALIALAGMIQLATGLDVAHSVDAYTPSPVQSALDNRWFMSLVRSHTAAGGVYAIVASLTASVFVFARTPRYRTLATLATLVLVVWGLMFAKSRAFIGAFGVSYLVICILLGLRLIRGGLWGLRDTRIARALAVLAIALVTYACTTGLHERMTGRTEIARVTARERVPYHTAAWRMIADHPFFGVGIGNYAREMVATGVKLEMPPKYADMMHAHNSYLHMLAEMGLVGLLPFLGFIGFVGVRLFRTATNPRLTEMSRAVAVGALAAFAGQLAAAAFDHNLWSPQIMIPATTLAGIALGAGAVPGEGGAPEASGSEGDAKA
jgi:O-antigen ligase